MGGVTKVLYLGLNDDVPEFDNDTIIVVVNDSHPFRGETRPFNRSIGVSEMPSLPGYVDWLDNHGNPGPTEAEIINWNEANEYADEQPDQA